MSAAETAALKLASQNAATALQAVETQIHTQVTLFRAQYAGVKPSAKNPIPTPPIFKTLQAQKDTAILNQVAALQAAMGATRFQQFDGFVQTVLTPHITVTTVGAARPPGSQRGQYYANHLPATVLRCAFLDRSAGPAVSALRWWRGTTRARIPTSIWAATRCTRAECKGATWRRRTPMRTRASQRWRPSMCWGRSRPASQRRLDLHRAQCEPAFRACTSSGYRSRRVKSASCSRHWHYPHRATPGETTVIVASVATRYLQPGESKKDEIILNKLYDLSKPGKYTVQVLGLDDVRRTVKSNTITVTITSDTKGGAN